MATLADLAKLVRSKNAGPFWLTIDIMFDDAQAYRRARDAEIVNRAAIARLYNRDPAEIIVVNHDTALAIKRQPHAAPVHRTGWRCPREACASVDSPLEGDGFEPSVPGAREPVILRKVNCAGIDGAAKKFGGVPMVRIHLPPARSHVRT
jgi:Domain of unknown function (DUF4387)